jgi:hypothetical protein
MQLTINNGLDIELGERQSKLGALLQLSSKNFNHTKKI